MTARLNPTPTVVFTGFTPELVYSSDLSGAVAFLDDLTVTWGRRTMTEHHDPQVAKFSVIVLEPELTTFATFDWRGQAVQLRWSVDVPGVGPSGRTFFRGHVTECDLVPRTPDPRTGASRGATLSFTATGQLTDLGNRKTGIEAWPEESGSARLARIRAAAGAAVASITARTYFDIGPWAARNVNRTDVLSLLRSHFDSCGGDKMTYDPHTNAVSFTRRRAVPPLPVGSRKRVALFADTEFGEGVVPRPLLAALKYPMLDGNVIEAAQGALSNNIEANVSRVDYSWQESGSTATGTIFDPIQEATRGVVALSLSTEFRQNDWAKQTASDWLDALWREGGKYRPPPMTYRADKVDGFPSLDHAVLLIGGAELTSSETQGTGATCYVAGTLWAALGHPPVFGVIGGTIRYVGKGWQATVYGQPVWHDDLSEQRPVRCSELTSRYSDNSTFRFRWSDLARAVTFADLKHIAPR